MQVTPTRSYRCNYHPKGANAEDAHRAAFHITGCVIDGVERIEGGAA